MLQRLRAERRAAARTQAALFSGLWCASARDFGTALPVDSLHDLNMRMTSALWTSGHLIDRKTVRLNAFATVLAAMFFLLTAQILILLLLGVDLFIRAFVNPRYSPVFALNALVLDELDIDPSMVDAGPAALSAKIGFFCCLLIALLFFLDLGVLPFVAALMLEAYAGLEAFLGVSVSWRLQSPIERA
jgi:hypothetical protein